MENYSEILSSLRADGLYRTLWTAVADGAHITRGGVKMLNFATNDYLGISSDTDMQREFLASLDGGAFVMSSVSSRLLGGNNPAFAALENWFANAFSAQSGAEKSCLIFNGGYAANTSVLPALASSKDAVFCDKLVHASLIDALKLSDAKFYRYAHNDYSHLRRLLREHRAEFENAFIATEGVFSMDGDFADIGVLVEIKREFDCALYVDEAHSFGVFGNGGLGLCASRGLLGDVDIIMATLGKAAASQGAAVITSPQIRDVLINRARGFIFTTAIPPISALWTLFVCSRFSSPEMAARRETLAELSAYLRKILAPETTLGSSQIAPILVGDNAAACGLSRKLLDAGYCAAAVRYPTVPKNSARIRLSLNAKMSKSELEKFAAEFKNLRQNEIQMAQ